MEEDDAGASDAESTASSSVATTGNRQHKPKRPAAVAKTLHSKKRKMKRSRNYQSRGGNVLDVKPGDQVVVETLVTRSEAEVVWQDGTVEKGISSKDLFPIHHLDDQEFFCGDFVVRGHEPDDDPNAFNPYEYGVVQDVDHLGRTCRVKWFETYKTRSEPK
jgi:ubiquitin-conjugating enzyme E2 O